MEKATEEARSKAVLILDKESDCMLSRCNLDCENCPLDVSEDDLLWAYNMAKIALLGGNNEN